MQVGRGRSFMTKGPEFPRSVAEPQRDPDSIGFLCQVVCTGTLGGGVGRGHGGKYHLTLATGKLGEAPFIWGSLA